MADANTAYRLYYWPMLPGRGEFLRLILEDAGADYVDVARLPESEGGGIAAITRLMQSETQVFASPILEVDGQFFSQLPNLAAYLGAHLNLAPESELGRLRANQVMLSICDIIDEAHDTHHPISTALRYEDQVEAAKLASTHFITSRLPRLLGHLEELSHTNGGQLLASGFSYCDLSLFQLIDGLRFAFPNAMMALASEIPSLMAIHSSVAERPRVTAYRSSERWLGFNEMGIFRCYPELDSE